MVSSQKVLIDEIQLLIVHFQNNSDIYGIGLYYASYFKLMTVFCFMVLKLLVELALDFWRLLCHLDVNSVTNTSRKFNFLLNHPVWSAC